MTPHIFLPNQGIPYADVLSERATIIVTLSREAKHTCSISSLATEVQTIPQPKRYHTFTFTPALSHLESP